MRRREFIAGLGGAAAWPLVARAQQADGVRRIGVLMNTEATRTFEQSCVAAFTDALSKLGWVDGRNLHMALRWNAADPHAQEFTRPNWLAERRTESPARRCSS